MTESEGRYTPDAAVEGWGLPGHRLPSALISWDGFVAALILLLLVVYFPPFYFDSWTPRFALVLAMGPLGLVLITLWCLRRDRASLLLAAALGWTVLGGAFSDAPRSALLGFSGRDLSALTIAGAAGFWAIGRMVTDRGRTLAPVVVVLASAFGAAVGVAQVTIGVDSGPLALLYGRPTGLASNPVYFGALCAMGAVTAASIWTVSLWRWLTPCLVVLGVGTTLSGSRVALLAVVLTGLALLVVHRSRDRVLGCTVLLGALIAGVALDRAIGAGSNAADRLAVTEGSGDGRLAIWRYGIEALADRPVLGYGFGRFRPAVQGRFSAEFVRDSAPDELTQAWFDPHNVLVLLLVSVGVVGTFLYLAWAGAWAWTTRGPLVWALATLGCHWSLQPVSLFTLPLALLLFGIAGRTSEPMERARTPSWLLPSSALFGLILAGGLVVNDLRLAAAVAKVDGDAVASVSRWFPNDPITADITARVYEAQATSESSEDVLAWRTRATEFEPDRPLWWSTLARTQFDLGRDEEAERSVATALELQPFNLRSQRIEVLLALRARDEERLQDALELACVLGQSDCELDAASLIDQLPD